jgi:8-oxo-dGTP diphosphatase
VARREFVVAAAILLDKAGRVLLVGNDWQGFGNVRHTLPGGVVERNESILDALVREVKEETGLEIKKIQQLAYTVHVEDVKRNDRAVSFVFVASYDGLLNPRDPDGYIVEARFYPVEEVEKIIPLQPLREPLANYLRDRQGGKFYFYGSWDGKDMRSV